MLRVLTFQYHDHEAVPGKRTWAEWGHAPDMPTLVFVLEKVPVEVPIKILDETDEVLLETHKTTDKSH